jgi:uncharacterized protein (DUF58 family)
MSSNFSARAQPLPVTQIRLRLRNVYILPSRHGLMLGLFIVTILLGSMQYSNSMGFLLAFMLSAMSLLGVFYTYYNLVGLTISASAGESVFAGDLGSVPLWFDNRGFSARFAIKIQSFQGLIKKQTFRDLFNLGSQKDSQTTTFDLNADQLQRIDLPVLTDKRGLLTLGRITLSTTFPLGLFYAWTYLELQNAQLLVYPRPRGVLPFPQGLANEGRSASLRGDGEDFSGFRAYILGDSPHHIDWKAAARERGLLIKQFSGNEGAQQYVFNIQDVTSLGDVELALSQLCDWIIQAHHQGLHYGLILPTVSLSPSNEETHYHVCLSALANFEST